MDPKLEITVLRLTVKLTADALAYVPVTAAGGAAAAKAHALGVTLQAGSVGALVAVATFGRSGRSRQKCHRNQRCGGMRRRR